MNWNSGAGSYELEQLYAVYANQSYSTCKVIYKKFNPFRSGVEMGCGIRKKPGDEDLILEDGILISSGPELIRDPEKIDERADWFVPFIGKALVVKKAYQPAYQFTGNAGGNHTFKVHPDKENRFEYMIFAGWSEGAVYNTRQDFEAYVRKTAYEFNHPIEIEYIRIDQKEL
jgi:hypothetical protein